MADYQRARQLARQETARFVGDLRALPPGAWARPTCCAGWNVVAEVRHIVFVAGFLFTNVSNGLRGVTEGFTPQQRQRAMEQLGAMGPSELATELEQWGRRLNDLLAGFTPEQLELPGWHPNGLRPMRWFCLQWLQEIACHRWDVQHAAGDGAEPPPFDDACAEVLLPMLATSNLPAAYRRFGPKDARASYVVGVPGRPDLLWTLRAENGDASAEPGAGPAQASILGQPSWLTLALWGRLPIAGLRAQGRLTVEGDVAAAERFKEVFKGP